MIFAHSFSPIEKRLAEKISLQLPITQLNLNLISDTDSIGQICGDTHQFTFLYSFQSLSYYQHLNTFQKECEVVDFLLEYLLKNEFSKVILITYPDAYFNAGNLFLQHKGFIEQKFVSSGIDCTLFSVQAIGDEKGAVNSLHQLFYDETKTQYIIPKKTNSIVYSIQLENLVELILKANENTFLGKYDVFDTVFPLSTFLKHYSNVENIQQVAPLFLYFRTYLGTYISLTMLELFLTSAMNLYKYRTEKEFGIQLNPVSFDSSYLVPSVELFNFNILNNSRKLIDYNSYSIQSPLVS